MNLDLGQLLRSTWKIGWNHKRLWLIQLVPALLGTLVLPLVWLTNPAFSASFNPTWDQGLPDPRLMAASMVAGVIVGLGLGLISALAGALTMLGALEIDRGIHRLSLRELFDISLPFLWPLTGLYLLFGAAWIALFLALFVLSAGVLIVTLGMGSLCLTPLMMLLIPVAWAGYAVLEFAQAAILSDGLSVQASISRAWQLVRHNVLPVILVLVLQYLAGMALSLVLMIPIMLPLAGLALSSLSEGDPRAIFSSSFMPWMPLAMGLGLVVQGILNVFIQAMWAISYRRLSGRPAALSNLPITAIAERD